MEEPDEPQRLIRNVQHFQQVPEPQEAPPPQGPEHPVPGQEQELLPVPPGAGAAKPATSRARGPATPQTEKTATERSRGLFPQQYDFRIVVSRCCSEDIAVLDALGSGNSENQSCIFDHCQLKKYTVDFSTASCYCVRFTLRPLISSASRQRFQKTCFPRFLGSGSGRNVSAVAVLLEKVMRHFQFCKYRAIQNCIIMLHTLFIFPLFVFDVRRMHT